MTALAKGSLVAVIVLIGIWAMLFAAARMTGAPPASRELLTTVVLALLVGVAVGVRARRRKLHGTGGTGRKA